MVRHALAVAALIGLATAFSPQAYADSGTPRVSAMYTTWDSYYFYAGFQVNDRTVISTNNTPVSQPQQDDDVELFFETDDARAVHRTPNTYQMAVSAANGAYFSVGNNSSIPEARVVYTYKYAATVDGALNDPSTLASGFTVEIAIPWQELGMSGPPAPGTVWGFNAISRDRTSLNAPPAILYSLSGKVKSAADVQNPSKWTKIEFDSADSAATSSSLVICPHVTTRFPLINGSIVSGEWPSGSRLSFGTVPVDAPAPTTAQEPNTKDSPFATAPTEQVPSPTVVAPAAPAQVAKEAPSSGPTAIALPGGGSIRIVPGGIKNPAGLTPPDQAGSGMERNPLAPKYAAGYEPPPPGVRMTGSLSLGSPIRPNLVMAVYRLDFNGDQRQAGGQNVWDSTGKSLLIDQPMEGVGPWFSGLRSTWQRQQLWDMRRAGIDVALIRPVDGDKQLPAEVDALVAALKDLKNSGQDYPLIGVDAAGNSAAHIAMVLDRVPDEFRAKWPVGDNGQLAALVWSGDATASVPDSLADGVPVTVVKPGESTVVMPGGIGADGALTARRDGSFYDASWGGAVGANAQTVVLDSWNDYAHGTDLDESRQYGHKYVDDTRIHTIEYNGNREWHAKYLAYSIPRTFRPKTIYTVSLRIENAGTLPWRAGEGYALCPRWYRDGRLYDDSAPRIPLAHDVFPGQSATINLGIVAMNGYGDDLEPGNYVLVLDMVQGTDKWFSYASESPLQIPVTVVAKDAPVSGSPAAAFLGSTTPVVVEAGATPSTTITLRNDGDSTWSADAKLAYKIVDGSGVDSKVVGEGGAFPLADRAIPPGEYLTIPAKLATAGVEPGSYRLRWYVVDGGTPVSGSYDEGLDVVAAAVRPSFVLSDIPRSVSAGKEFVSKLAVRNLGSRPWAKGEFQIGYHWYYLDGVEAAWDGGIATPLPQPIAPGQADPEISAKARAPQIPGRYILAWDVRTEDAGWISTQSDTPLYDILPVVITVTGKSAVETVDLSKYAPSADPAFANGAQLPAGMLPPDGAGEVDVNPLLLGKPGPPLYPSGYYAGVTGSGWSSNHDVPFLYSGEAARNGMPCTGQRIALPAGTHEVHLLAAVDAGDSVSAAFGLGASQTTLTVTSWKTAPAAPAWFSPYSLTADGGIDASPCYLGDYALQSTSGADTLVLPNAPLIRVFAVTAQH